jgi:RimJ/RimL family protein N-acetyltransferase
MQDLSTWTPRSAPAADVLEGRFTRLERLSSARHGDELFAASSMPDADARFRWLPEYPPQSREGFQPWLDNAEASADPLFYAVIDKATGKVAGRQTFMRIDTANGVIEIGNILWSSLISRTPVTTEAFYLFARHAFDDLGYRRFEWKCNDRNEPSKSAAIRFGMAFEGVFRQHLVVKGENRDTAWFSLLDREWPQTKAAFEIWLAPENFDADGRQRVALSALTARSLEANGVAFARIGPEARPLVEEIQNSAYARTRDATGGEPMPLRWDYASVLAECEAWLSPNSDGLLILRRAADYLYLESIATLPAAAGSGLGKAMMQATFDRARALGLPEIRLMTNARNPALTWYKRLGFVLDREENMGGDRIAVHMVAKVA